MAELTADIPSSLRTALDREVARIVGIHVDYRDNPKLFEMVNEAGIH